MTETTERIIQEKQHDLEQKRLRMNQLATTIEEIKCGDATVSDPLVLGMIISEYNALEREMRHGYAALYAKCNPINKPDARSFFLGYYVDDEGYAINPETKERLETIHGQLLNIEPDKLPLSSVGALPIELGDSYIGMITRNDPIAIKEYISNFDVPISDGINTLYLFLGSIQDWDKLDLPEHMEAIKKLWQEIGSSVTKSVLHEYKRDPITYSKIKKAMCNALAKSAEAVEKVTDKESSDT